MTRSSKILAVAFALAALTLWTAPASAQCGNTTPFGNFFGTVANCDDSGPVTGTLQAIDGNGKVVFVTDDTFICRSQTQLGCEATRAGADGDGVIAFAGDWANPNISGCPTDAGGTAGGRNFYNITDASGNQLQFSVGREGLAGYAADNAWPWSATGQTGNLECVSPRAGTTLNSITQSEIPGVGIIASVILTCETPQIRSDCDPDARGTVLARGSCLPTDPAFLGSIQALKLYQKQADCTGAGLNYGVARGGWGPVPGATDLGNGSWQAQIILPADGCTFLGCSFGNEQAPTTGTCASNGATCTSDANCPSACLGGTTPGGACTTNANCLGGCSLLPALTCQNDAGCLGSFGTCTSPPPGTCAPGTCVFGDPIQTEYPQVDSAIALGAQNAPSPVALAVAVGLQQGHAVVTWRTDVELGLVGFEILKIGKDGQMTPIRQVSKKSPDGTSGTTYSESFKPGELHKQGAKGVVIKSLLTGGGEILSDPASF